MSRYIREFQLDKPIDVVSLVMDDYVYHNRLIRTDWNGEMVFASQDGAGSKCYMKWSYTAGVFHLEAWVRGMMGGERNPDGMGAGGKNFRKSLQRLEQQLKEHCDHVPTGYIGADTLVHEKNHVDDSPEARYKGSEGYDYSYPKKGKLDYNAALVLGIIAIFLCTIPMVGFFMVLFIMKICKGISKTGPERTIFVLLRIALVLAVLNTFWFLV